MDGTRTHVIVDQTRAVDACRLGDFADRLRAQSQERPTGPTASYSAACKTSAVPVSVDSPLLWIVAFRTVLADDFRDSNPQVASQSWEPTGSQRLQSSGSARPQSACISAVRRINERL
jgi:hypothetical protein